MGIETSLFFAFAAAICWGVGDFLIQKSVRKIGTVEALAAIGMIGSVILLPFVWHDIPQLFSPGNGILLLSLGIVTFAAAVLNFESYRIGKLSVVEVVLELELPITILLGILLFNETLSSVQVAIILIGFIGILLMSTKTMRLLTNHKNWLEKGAIIAAMGALGMGIVNFLTAAASRSISPLMAIWAPWVIFTIVCLFALHRQNKIRPFIHLLHKHHALIILMGIMDTFAWLFFAFALEGKELSITTAITESYPAIAIGLAVIFNKETIKRHQWIGAFLAIGGSIALAFFI